MTWDAMSAAERGNGMIDDIAAVIVGADIWGAMSAFERDNTRRGLLQVFRELPTREMVRAGLEARRNPKFGWDTDERRLIEEFRAMLQATVTHTG